MLFNKGRSSTRGDRAELDAERYLREQGLSTIAKNYRCKRGEIDLIMSDKDTIVFVEVRYRNNADYGSPLETVTKSKQKKLLIAAQYYLSEKKLSGNTQVRFDVVGICADQYQWIQSAFLAS